MQATRALESVTMVVLFVTSVCLGFYVLRESSRTKCMAIAVMSLISFAGKTVDNALGNRTGRLMYTGASLL